jgi:hypothetical protein
MLTQRFKRMHQGVVMEALCAERAQGLLRDISKKKILKLLNEEALERFKPKLRKFTKAIPTRVLSKIYDAFFTVTNG